MTNKTLTGYNLSISSKASIDFKSGNCALEPRQGRLYMSNPQIDLQMQKKEGRRQTQTKVSYQFFNTSDLIMILSTPNRTTGRARLCDRIWASNLGAKIIKLSLTRDFGLSR